jgi:hypothetical protein
VSEAFYQRLHAKYRVTIKVPGAARGGDGSQMAGDTGEGGRP